MYYHGHQFHPADMHLELFFIGCTHRCKDCHNPELWDVTESDTPISPDEIVKSLSDYQGIVRKLILVGGEPTEQSPRELRALCEGLRKSFPGAPIFLFTGLGMCHITAPAGRISVQAETLIQILDYVDFVKFGAFEAGNRVKDNRFQDIVLATANQYVVSSKEIKEILDKL